MNKSSFFKLRIYFTALVTVAIGSLLVWNHYHGGVPSHHILADESLPQISNLWGIVLLPLLTWFLTYRTQTRVFDGQDSNDINKQKTALYSLMASSLYGITMATFFSFGYPDMTGNVMFGIFLLALFFPVYRSECLLGFVLGMTVTFGAVLPMGIGSILTLISFLLFKTIRPAAVYVFARLIGSRS